MIIPRVKYETGSIPASALSSTTGMQSGLIEMPATTATVIPFSTNFSSTPKVVVTVGPSTATTSGTTVTISAVGTAGFTAYASHAGTITWMAFA